MNADHREPRVPFSGVTPAGSPAPSTQPPAGSFQPGGAPQANSGQSPVTGQQPQRRPLTGQQPQRTGQQPGQQPPSAPTAPGTAPSGTSTPQRTSVRSTLSGQQATAAAQPTTGVGAPFGAAGGAVFTPASSTAMPTSATTTTDADPDAPRRAKVMLQRIDPLSAIKMGFLLSVAAGVMLVVAVYVLWNVLNAAGTFALANEWVSKLFTEDQELNLMQFFHQGRVMSATILIAVVNVFILTLMSAIWAFLYNTVSTVVGGVFVTLSDE